MDRACDFVVVGQGLAGTAAAWHLRRRGRRVLVLDRGDPHAASRVAAGLVTPRTGRRLARTLWFDACFAAATAFYREVEAATGERFFHAGPAVRLFADAAERATAAAKLGDALDPGVNADWFAAGHGGCLLDPAARLDTARYLDASRAAFAADGGFRAAALAPADVEPTAAGVRLPRHGVEARGVIFCEGAGGVGNPWFPGVPYNPARGEVLTLWVPGLAETRTVHRGVWLAPLGGDRFLAGSTYDRDDLSPTPTAAGRAAIEAGVRAVLRLPFTVTDHRTGVRPVLRTTRPMLGVHPRFPGLAVFTGLGSKGSLYAPYFAGALVEHLLDARPIDPAVALVPGSPAGEPAP